MVRETGRSGYKTKLITKLETLFPGCIIQHQDPLTTHQGIPDMLILYKNTWAMLEVKASAKSVRQPNQEFYVDYYNRQSFASFIYPENEKEVLHGLQATFASSGPTRHAKP